MHCLKVSGSADAPQVDKQITNTGHGCSCRVSNSMFTCAGTPEHRRCLSIRCLGRCCRPTRVCRPTPPAGSCTACRFVVEVVALRPLSQQRSLCFCIPILSGSAEEVVLPAALGNAAKMGLDLWALCEQPAPCLFSACSRE